MEPPPQAAGDPLSLRDYVRPVWLRKWLILSLVAVATAGTYAYFAQKPEKYKTSTKVYFQDTGAVSILNPDAAQDPDRALLNQATLFTSREVSEKVAARIRFRGNLGELISSVQAQPAVGSDFIQVVAVRPSGAEAAAVANAFAQVYVARRAEEVRVALEGRLATAQQQLRRIPRRPGTAGDREDLASTIRQLQGALSVPGGIARQVDPAPVPQFPFSPRPKRNAAFAFVLALLAGLGLAFGLERFDWRIRRLSDVQSVYHRPLLAALPRVERPVTFSEMGDPCVPARLKEPFRSLRTAVRLAALEQPIKTILVTSAVSGEGKSMTARNLALIYREVGARVALVDFDLRRPMQPVLLGVEPTAGFTDVLVGEVSLADGLTPVISGEPSDHSSGAEYAMGPSGGTAVRSAHDAGDLLLLSSGSGSANPNAILATERVHELMAELNREFDVVVFDTSPLLAVSDAAALVREADAVLVVARLGKTTTTGAERLMEMLDRIPGSNVIGVVANDVPSSETGDYYGYYGYGYGASSG